MKKDKTVYEKRINSNSGFHDPDKIKYQMPEDKPKDGNKSPWDFRCPQYDQRSSNFLNAGTDYGRGINQPVGHKGNPKRNVPCLPMVDVNTMRVDEE